MVRIDLSPAESPLSLPELLSRVENPGFPRGSARWLGDRVGRDAQGVSRSRQPAAISLSRHIPVPQRRWMGVGENTTSIPIKAGRSPT